MFGLQAYHHDGDKKRYELMQRIISEIEHKRNFSYTSLKLFLSDKQKQPPSPVTKASRSQQWSTTPTTANTP